MSGEVRSFRDLDAWKLAYRLGLDLYKMTRQFPAYERFGLASQLRRAGVSLASNIAEGFGRGSRQDYVRFLRIAKGSCNEIETQVQFALDLEYIDDGLYDHISRETTRVAQVLSGLIRSLR